MYRAIKVISRLALYVVSCLPLLMFIQFLPNLADSGPIGLVLIILLGLIVIGVTLLLTEIVNSFYYTKEGV